MGKDKNSMPSGGGDGGNTSNGSCSDNLSDCSRARILLCDTNADSSRHVFQLLTQCSYQGKQLIFFSFHNIY